jgi:hypothetical protein
LKESEVKYFGEKMMAKSPVTQYMSSFNMIKSLTYWSISVSVCLEIRLVMDAIVVVPINDAVFHLFTLESCSYNATGAIVAWH